MPYTVSSDEKGVRPVKRQPWSYHRLFTHIAHRPLQFPLHLCMPEEGVQSLAHEDILRIEEIEEAVRVAAGMGIRASA